MQTKRRIGLMLLATMGSCLVAVGQNVPVYTYSANYDGVGNVSSYSDSANGNWTLGYTPLNQLQTATSTGTVGPYHGLALTLGYDSFGNRTAQTPSGSPPNTVPTAWANYNANNQITSSNQNMAPSYDAAGDMTFDGTNQVAYDPEGRVCAVYNGLGGGYTQYFYDAEGHRVGKATVSSLTCSLGGSGTAMSATYLLGPSGEQMTELDGSNNWKHTNIFASGQLVATYDTTGLHFSITDPLGSVRVNTTGLGASEQTCVNLPFGDQLSCTGGTQFPTEQKFTGKERDTESGLDYFGARYYSSNMGRFMSPDWAAKAQPVPYAKLDDPQSLNLYGYVRNNPLSRTDADGHDGGIVELILTGVAVVTVFNHAILAHHRAKLIDADQNLINLDWKIINTRQHQPDVLVEEAYKEILRLQQDQRDQSVGLIGDILSTLDSTASAIGGALRVKPGTGPKDAVTTGVQQTEKNLNSLIPGKSSDTTVGRGSETKGESSQQHLNSNGTVQSTVQRQAEKMQNEQKLK